MTHENLDFRVFDHLESASDLKGLEDLYLESDGGRNWEVYQIFDMEAFLAWFREKYPTEPNLVKIKL